MEGIGRRHWGLTSSVCSIKGFKTESAQLEMLPPSSIATAESSWASERLGWSTGSTPYSVRTCSEISKSPTKFEFLLLCWFHLDPSHVERGMKQDEREREREFTWRGMALHGSYEQQYNAKRSAQARKTNH